MHACLLSWGTDVYVDDAWHAVWIKTMDTDTGGVYHIGFYVYA